MTTPIPDEAVEAAKRALREEGDSPWHEQLSDEDAERLVTEHYDGAARAALAAAAPILLRQWAAQTAHRIRAELVCCDVYERDHDTDRAGTTHAICFWGEAAARLVEDDQGEHAAHMRANLRGEWLMEVDAVLRDQGRHIDYAASHPEDFTTQAERNQTADYLREVLGRQEADRG